MKNIPSLALLLTIALSVSCATPLVVSRVGEGAEGVVVTTDPDRVKDAKYIESGWVSFAPRSGQKVEKAHIYAKNFTHEKGGDLALLETSLVVGRRLVAVPYARRVVTVKAYKERERQ